MSSPGQIVEPRARPQSGMSATSTPFQGPSNHRRAFKGFGQEYQFAETWANPPPELVVGPAGAPVGEDVSQADGIHELGRNDGSSRGSFPKEEAAAWTPPPDTSWRERIPHLWWIIAGVTFSGIIVVVLGILAGLGVLGGHGAATSVFPSTTISLPPPAKLTPSSLPEASSSTSSTSSSSSMTSTSTSSVKSSHPTPTAVIKDCSVSSSFHNSIEWVGVDAGYKSDYDPANSAEECCKRCFTGDGGCAGWLYNSTNKFTPCTKIMITADHPGADDACPKGYSPATFFSKGGDGIAGVGPCSNGAQES